MLEADCAAKADYVLRYTSASTVRRQLAVPDAALAAC